MILPVEEVPLATCDGVVGNIFGYWLSEKFEMVHITLSVHILVKFYKTRTVVSSYKSIIEKTIEYGTSSLRSKVKEVSPLS